MILSVLSALMMSALALGMLLKANEVKTCRAALLPLAAAGMEWLMVGYLTPAAFPLLTVLLVALRLLLAGCCLTMLRRDMARARQKARRQKLARRLEARTLPTVPGLHERPYIAA